VPPSDPARVIAVVREACGQEDVDRALTTVLKATAESFAWDVAELWVVAADGAALEVAHTSYCRDDRHRPLVEAARGFTVAPGIGLPGVAWQSGQPVAARDVRTDARFARAAFARDFGVRGALSIPILSPTGPVAVFSFFATRSRALDGALVDFVATVSGDVAALVRRRRQSLERRLQDTEQRYRTLFDRSPAGVFIARIDGTIVEGNSAIARMLGRPGQDVAGRQVSSFLVEPAEWERLVVALGVVDVVNDVELRVRGADDEVRWLLLNATRTGGRDDVRIEGQTIDVTDRRRIEEDFRAREALRGVAALARATGHEILNPLTPLIGRLTRVLPQLDTRARAEVDAALDSARRIHDIVRRMLNITELKFTGRTPHLDEILDIGRSGAGAAEGERDGP
jgi:PAS domain S-box-containing protein